jgi:MFS family permease
MIIAFLAGRPEVFALGFALAGACAGVTYVSSLIYSLQGRAAGRGARCGIHETVLGSGVLLGPLLGGLVASRVDLRSPFVLAATVFLLVAVADLLVWRRTIRPTRLRDRAAAQAEVAGQ